jgi:hypothetical protein
MSAAALAAVLCLAVLPPAALAHHLGTYTPRDNEISANVKQIKFSVDARKFDVARRLFEDGAVRREMREQAAKFPPGLEAATLEGLRAADAPEVERALMVFLAALARTLALEAQQQMSAPGASVEARMAAGRLFLEAIWRYYNLIDYAASRRAPKIAVAVRLAFDDAEGLANGAPAGGAALAGGDRGGPAQARNRPTGGAAPADPLQLRGPFQRIAQALGELIIASART